MKQKIRMLPFLFFLISLFAFKAESTSKIEIQDKCIYISYVLEQKTAVTLNITDKNGNLIELIENTNDPEGIYKIKYRLLKYYQAGEYCVNVIFYSKIITSKFFTIDN